MKEREIVDSRMRKKGGIVLVVGLIAVNRGKF